MRYAVDVVVVPVEVNSAMSTMHFGPSNIQMVDSQQNPFSPRRVQHWLQASKLISHVCLWWQYSDSGVVCVMLVIVVSVEVVLDSDVVVAVVIVVCVMVSVFGVVDVADSVVIDVVVVDVVVVVVFRIHSTPCVYSVPMMSKPYGLSGIHSHAFQSPIREPQRIDCFLGFCLGVNLYASIAACVIFKTGLFKNCIFPLNPHVPSIDDNALLFICREYKFVSLNALLSINVILLLTKTKFVTCVIPCIPALITILMSFWLMLIVVYLESTVK